MAVAGLGDRALGAFVAAGVLAGHQPEEGADAGPVGPDREPAACRRVGDGLEREHIPLSVGAAIAACGEAGGRSEQPGCCDQLFLGAVGVRRLSVVPPMRVRTGDARDQRKTPTIGATAVTKGGWGDTQVRLDAVASRVATPVGRLSDRRCRPRSPRRSRRSARLSYRQPGPPSSAGEPAPSTSLSLCIGGAVCSAWTARGLQFYWDDWAIVSALNRGDFSLSWLMANHNEHWILLPKLVYSCSTDRGLRVSLAIHRGDPDAPPRPGSPSVEAGHSGGADPWLATLAALGFALYAAGVEDILFPIQMATDRRAWS